MSSKPVTPPDRTAMIKMLISKWKEKIAAGNYYRLQIIFQLNLQQKKK